jgi:hypothetical protein
LPDGQNPKPNPATVNFYHLRRDLEEIASREHCAIADVVRRAVAREVRLQRRRDQREERSA